MKLVVFHNVHNEFHNTSYGMKIHLRSYIYVKDLFTETGFKTLEEIGVNLVNKRNGCNYVSTILYVRYSKTFNCRM